MFARNAALLPLTLLACLTGCALFREEEPVEDDVVWAIQLEGQNLGATAPLYFDGLAILQGCNDQLIQVDAFTGEVRLNEHPDLGSCFHSGSIFRRNSTAYLLKAQGIYGIELSSLSIELDLDLPGRTTHTFFDIVGDTAFVGGNGFVNLVSLAGKRVLQSFAIGAERANGLRFDRDRNRLIVATSCLSHECDGSYGTVYCYQLPGFVELWHYKLQPAYFGTNPIIADNSYIVQSDDEVIAFEKSTGDVLYSAELIDCGYCQPEPFGDKLLIANQRTVRCIRADNLSTVWDSQGWGRYLGSSKGFVLADSVAYCINVGKLVKFNPESGQLLNVIEVDEPILTLPAVHGDTVFVSTDRAFYALVTN